VTHIVDHSDAHVVRILHARRTVVTCHDLLLLRALAGDLPYRFETANKGRSHDRAWERRFRWTVSHLERAGAVVCDSESTRQDVRRFLSVDPDRLHVVPLGVSDAFGPLTPSARRQVRSALDLTSPTLLQMSSGGFYKNTEGVLRVTAKLRQAGMDVTLVRVGVPLSEDERKLAGRLGLASALREQGRVSDEELAALYGSADVLLFPSTGEGFGWPVLEAMTCGLPVVASSIPALSELVGEAGLLAQPDDIDGLTSLVASVLSDAEEARRQRDTGIERAASYRWERTLTGYARIYKEVAGAKSG
jgi:glycosyltransferase involved in cell wall biosynthesis